MFFDPDCQVEGDEFCAEFFVLRRGKNVPSGPIECCWLGM